DLREVREGADARVLVSFVVERSRAADLSPFRVAAEELMRTVPAVAGVAANLHAGEQPRVLGSETVVLAAATAVEDRVGASVHLATFGSFVQAHRGQSARVHALVAEAVGLGASDAPPTADTKAAPRVLDLYGGSGSIALALAGLGARVKLI